ncbi:MAG TPA: tetratricopeptide repeat protein [Pirellulaceae bacterium]|jgi:tetratricopeptide (TPR) repeat protein
MVEEPESGAAVALTSRGVRLAKQGHFDDAANCLRLALASDPGYLLAHKNLVIVLESLGDLGGAIQACELLLQNSPNAAGIRNKLGSLCAKQGNFDGALNHFRNALALGYDR